MRFSNKREEFIQTVESVCLFINFGAIFLQIWILLSAIESSFRGNDAFLFPSVVLSGLAFLASVVAALLTNMDFLRGIMEGRTKSYSASSKFTD